MAKTAVAIIAGGKGTRLFPFSNEGKAKQFCMSPLGEITFLQDSISRFVQTDIVTDSDIHIIVTNEIQYRHAIRQSESFKIIEPHIHLISPDLNFGGACVEAAQIISAETDAEIIIFTPADQYIEYSQNWSDSVKSMVESAREAPTLLGVRKNDLNTVRGCGNIKFSKIESYNRIDSFIEKPDEETAKELLKVGESLVNTGIFAIKTSHIPTIEKTDLRTDILMTELAKITGELRVIEGQFCWYDVGTFKSFWEISHKTPNHRNASFGEVDRYECRNSLFIAPTGIKIYAAGIANSSVIVEIINEKIVVGVIAHESCQLAGGLANDFSQAITNHFSIDASNNGFCKTNASRESYAGFVGVSNITTTVLKQADGTFIVSVCQE